MRTVAVLFACRDSIYKKLPGCEVYDIDRDARTFPGGCPVVAHPPCRTWGRLRHMANAPPDEHGLAIWAVEVVRREGGVIEHPAGSLLWQECGLPLPGELWGRGTTLAVDQCHWGHRARKRTWLYVCGLGADGAPSQPCRDWTAGKPPCVVDTTKRGHGQRPRITKREREATPPAFARWLCELARRCNAQLEEVCI